jgi:hypothetical protein
VGSRGSELSLGFDDRGKRTVRVRFEPIRGQDICVVSVAPSGKPVFAKPPKGSAGNAEEFWVRTGNATKQYHGDDMFEYREQHWGWSLSLDRLKPQADAGLLNLIADERPPARFNRESGFGTAAGTP